METAMYVIQTTGRNGKVYQGKMEFGDSKYMDAAEYAARLAIHNGEDARVVECTASGQNPKIVLYIKHAEDELV